MITVAIELSAELIEQTRASGARIAATPTDVLDYEGDLADLAHAVLAAKPLDLVGLVARARAEERERCAELLAALTIADDDHGSDDFDSGVMYGVKRSIAVIRKLGPG